MEISFRKFRILPFIIAALLIWLVIISFGCIQNETIVATKVADAFISTRLAWSSQSDKLAITDEYPNELVPTAYIYRVQGRTKLRLLKKLNQGFGQLELPSWSPDDKYLAAGAIPDFPHTQMSQIAIIIYLKTGENLEYLPSKTSVGSNHFFWLDNDRIVNQNDNSIVAFSLKNKTNTLLFVDENIVIEDLPAILKRRYVLAQGYQAGSLSLRRQMFIIDLKTGRTKPLRGPLVNNITVSNNGRAIVISGAHWLVRDNRRKYVSGTVRDAKMSSTKLKLGGKLKFQDKSGKILRPVSINISPDGKTAAFTALDRKNKEAVYLAKLPNYYF